MSAQSVLKEMAFPILEEEPTSPEAVFRLFLTRNNIHPFTSKSVARYKTAMIRIPNLKASIYLWVVNALFLATVLSFPVVVISFPASVFLPDAWIKLLFYVSSILFVVGLLFTLLGFRKTVSPLHWETISEGDYRFQLPKRVRQIRYRIRRAFPEAKFFIDQLMEQDVIIDPFLVVQYKKDKYVVAVWDEPGYKAKTLI